MPQMGESIAEGTVSRWLKQVGDPVQRDEALLEISTDKVDAEIPSPSEGILVEILVKEGETVEVGTVVAYVDPEASSAPVPAAPAPEPSPENAEVSGPPAAAVAPSPVDASSQDADSQPGDQPATAAERLRTRSTPVVRRIAEEHGIDLAEIPGTGHAGRVTKQDILGFMEGTEEGTEGPPATPPAGAQPGPAAPPPAKDTSVPPAPRVQGPAASAAPSDLWSMFYSQVQHPEFPVRQRDRVEPMDKIRRLTAEHMVVAKRVAPHVHSFIEVDFTRIDQVRNTNKALWAQQGAKVSYTAFVVWACSRLLREFPPVNGTVSGNNLIYRGNVNVGVAVDLDPGLIVPVIHDADELSLLGIGKRIADLAERARTRRLIPEEIQGATFSLTNPGVLGTVVGMPIIPKGTSAILGTGAIEKRVVVVEDPASGADAMAIRKRCFFSLGYDHRIVDGADAARFLARLKQLLESFPEDA